MVLPLVSCLHAFLFRSPILFVILKNLFVFSISKARKLNEKLYFFCWLVLFPTFWSEFLLVFVTFTRLKLLLIQDKSWRVRYMVANQLYELCEAVGPDPTR